MLIQFISTPSDYLMKRCIIEKMGMKIGVCLVIASLDGRGTVLFFELCTHGLSADLAGPLTKLSSLGLHLNVIFSSRIFSNVIIKPYSLG